MDCSVMDGDESIGLQKRQELVQEVVWVDMYEFKQVIQVFFVEMACSAFVLSGFANDITSLVPELLDPKPGTSRKATDIQDIL